MKKLIEITLISIILFLLAVLVGCKEKAEAGEPNNIFIDNPEPPKIIYYYDGEKKIEYIPRPNKPKRHVTEVEKTKALEIIKESSDMLEGLEPEILIQKVLDSIPTWPEYVELERNLIIVEPNVYIGSYVQQLKISLEKGTKIYYEDE